MQLPKQAIRPADLHRLIFGAQLPPSPPVKRGKKMCRGPKIQTLKNMLEGLAVHANKETGECWPSQGTFAAAYDLHVRTVQRAFDRLRELGILRSMAPGWLGRHSKTHWLDFAALSRLAPAKDGSEELDALLREYARLRVVAHKSTHVQSVAGPLRDDLSQAILTVSQQSGATRKRAALGLMLAWFSVEAEVIVASEHRLDWIGPYLDQLVEKVSAVLRQPGPVGGYRAAAAAVVEAIEKADQAGELAVVRRPA